MRPVFDFIAEARRDNRPFFVWYAPMMPHSPHNPPERLFDKYAAAAPSPHVARYWAMIEWFDESVGQLLDHLGQQQLERDTIVVYVADNGWIQSRDNPRYAARSKQSQYDGGLRTPIMIRWPGHVEPKMSDSLSVSVDIMPTVLSAVGLSPTDQMQGINLLDSEAVAQRKAVFGECFTHNAVSLDDPAANLRWRWMVENDWKLIVPNAKNEPGATVELFHITEDPHEERNLAGQQPDRVAALRAQLDKWWNPATAKRLSK